MHKSTARDYLARVNDPEYPKEKAAELAKKWGFDYWEGDRRICYGGYHNMPGRWMPVAKSLATMPCILAATGPLGLLACGRQMTRKPNFASGTSLPHDSKISYYYI